MQHTVTTTFGGKAGAKPVKVAPGIYAWSPQTHTFPLADYDVTIQIEAQPYNEEHAGRFVCSDLRVTRRPDGPPVTLAGIRSIGVGDLTAKLGAGHVMTAEPTADGGIRLVDKVLTEEVVARVKADGPTDDTLRWVAHLYRLAVVVGNGPRKAVEEALSLPRATAGRWIALARERGFLGPSEGQGKAGG